MVFQANDEPTTKSATPHLPSGPAVDRCHAFLLLVPAPIFLIFHRETTLLPQQNYGLYHSKYLCQNCGF